MSLSTSQSTMEWTPEMEINLFYSMIDHKPVGENKHFHMMFIYERFNNLSEKKLSVEQIWEHLNLLYDLPALDDMEVVPYPSEEVDFSLPEMDTSKSSNSDDLESSIKSTSTTGRYEPVRPPAQSLTYTPGSSTSAPSSSTTAATTTTTTTTSTTAPSSNTSASASALTTTPASGTSKASGTTANASSSQTTTTPTHSGRGNPNFKLKKK